MSEPERDKPKKRSLWQLHISTAVVLMFIVTIWLAICFKVQTGRNASGQHGYGMPFPFFYADNLHSSHFNLDYVGLAVDILCVSVLSLKIAQFCEGRIRRREGRKT